MFTGIVEEIGKIKAVRRGGYSIVLEVEAVKVLEGTRIGDSIATNGVCLTVTALGAGFFFCRCDAGNYEAFEFGIFEAW